MPKLEKNELNRILEEAETSGRKGLVIRTLVELERLHEAAEIAFNEFGIERALKLYLNDGKGEEAAKFAERRGYLREACELYFNNNQEGAYKRVSELIGRNGYTKKRPGKLKKENHLGNKF